MNYRAFARDLHALADLLDATAADLPEPKYHIPLSIGIHCAEAVDVAQAAKALGVDAKVTPAGHSTATLRIDSVEFQFIHITDAAMAAHNARAEYARTMPAAVAS